MKRIFVLTLLAGLKSMAQQGICFSPTYSASTSLYVITIADFNNDGNQDAAGIATGTHVGVYFGSGTGSFSLSNTYAVVPSPTTAVNPHVTSGDFNNDGWTDLATANFHGGSPEVSVLMNNGSGAFGTAAVMAAGSSSNINGPVGIISSDINNDGNQDLFVLEQGEGYTLLGTGTGSFVFNSALVVPNLSVMHGSNFTACMATGHFNNDAYRDIAYGTGTAVAVMLGTSSGSLGAPAYYYAGSDQFALADFNNDGRTDIGTIGGFLLGSSSGTFASSGSSTFPSTSAMAPTWGVGAGEFDGDGFADLAIQTPTSVLYLNGTGTGQISRLSSFAVNTGFCMVKATDANNDGRIDLLFAGNNFVSTGFSSFLNRRFPMTVSSTPSLVCSGISSTLTAAGALTSYSWTGGGTNGPKVVTPTVSSTFSVTGTGTTGCMVTQTVQVNVSSPTLVVSTSPASVCPFGTSTPTVGGALTYSWATGPMTSTISVTPSVTTIYTVSGSNALGCVSTKTVMVYVYTPGTMTVSGPSQICTGQAATLAAVGAVSLYTFYPAMITGFQAVVMPLSNTCYTAVGNDGNGCSISSVLCITVHPLPAVAVAGNFTQCAGATQSLTASGGNIYLWSNSVSGPVNVISPLTGVCYTVMGTDANLCTNQATFCVSVNSATVSVSPSTPTVCSGSSVTFTSSSAASYTWSGGSNSPTLNMLPGANTLVTVDITASNGCTASATATLYLDSGCSMVWPGDANSDGIVNSFDVLEIGLGFSQTGAPRTNASNQYNAQYAANWTGTVSSGKNLSHADCDGNGSIGFTDTVAIHNNFGTPHSFRSLQQTGTTFFLRPDGSGPLTAGQWNRIFVDLGDVSSPVSLYGAAFSVNFDAAIIETDSVYLAYGTSFLNSGNTNVEFRKKQFVSGIVHAATVRTDKGNASGYGQIAEFGFKLRAGVAEGAATSFMLTQCGVVDLSSAVLSTGGATLQMGVTNLASGLLIAGREQVFHLYPNPAMDEVKITDSHGDLKFAIYDGKGVLQHEGVVPRSGRISTSDLVNGIYYITLNSGTNHFTSKLVVLR